MSDRELYEKYIDGIWSGMPKPPYEGANPHPKWEELPTSRQEKVIAKLRGIK